MAWGDPRLESGTARGGVADVAAAAAARAIHRCSVALSPSVFLTIGARLEAALLGELAQPRHVDVDDGADAGLKVGVARPLDGDQQPLAAVDLAEGDCRQTSGERRACVRVCVRAARTRACRGSGRGAQRLRVGCGRENRACGGGGGVQTTGAPSGMIFIAASKLAFG